jgi:hypothetical protein
MLMKKNYRQIKGTLIRLLIKKVILGIKKLHLREFFFATQFAQFDFQSIIFFKTQGMGFKVRKWQVPCSLSKIKNIALCVRKALIQQAGDVGVDRRWSVVT